MQTFRLNSVQIHSFSTSKLKESFNEIVMSNSDPQIITTFNLDFLRISQNNKEFLQICKNSLWNLPDGIGIICLNKENHIFYRIIGKRVLLKSPNV